MCPDADVTTQLWSIAAGFWELGTPHNQDRLHVSHCIKGEV